MIRAYRHDIGREVSIPRNSLRYGPDTRAGSCRADLLFSPEIAQIGDRSVPYFLPFPGAKFAVRVTLSSPPGAASAIPAQPLVLSRPGDARLRALLDAAADALRSGAQEDEPDDLCTALALLAEALPCLGAAARTGRRSLWVRVRDFLDRQTAAEIRRASGLSRAEVQTLRSAVAWLRSSPIGSNPDVACCADDLCALTDRLVAGRV